MAFFLTVLVAHILSLCYLCSSEDYGEVKKILLSVKGLHQADMGLFIWDNYVNDKFPSNEEILEKVLLLPSFICVCCSAED